MKIIVIEGTDNTGKDTLINNLLDKYKDKKCKVIHCERPIHTDNWGAQIEQDYKFLSLVDDIKNNVYPMPINCVDKDEVFVGRIRRDFSIKNGINLWVVADNIRKGAATNAVQILLPSKGTLSLLLIL